MPDPVPAGFRTTLRAIDPDGQTIIFRDYVYEGEAVDVWNDAEVETGFRGRYRVYFDDEGEPRLRPEVPDA